MASSRSSGLQSADALIYTGRNRINAITVLTDGTNAATLVVYDATSATGTVVAKAVVAGASLTGHFIFENPVLCENGIYADVTGIGAGYIVYFGG